MKRSPVAGRPLAITIGVAFGLAVVEQLFRPSVFSFFSVLSAEPYFRRGALPWPGLIAAIALSSMMLFGATKNIVRQDF